MSIIIPKQLILAGSDRLDKELMIGHMQGRFKLSVIKDVGHCIQEDSPLKLAANFVDFLSMFKIPVKANELKIVTNASGKQVVIGGPPSKNL